MSTTVSYKGSTIATVSNDTKTLLTEGKYLEDDITLVDVSGGGAVLTTKNISENGTYNASSDSADGYSQVTVAVPASAVDSGTKNITANGNGQDVIGYAAVNVNVPNTYSAGDEGKVVSNGALVAQTSDTVTENDTYDTTLINSLTVNVSGGGLSWDDLATNAQPSGNIVLTSNKVGELALANRKVSSSWTCSSDTVLNLEYQAFNSNAKLFAVSFPNLTNVSGDYVFQSNTILKIVDIGKSTKVGSAMFRWCDAFDTLVIRKTDGLVTLPSANAIAEGTKFKSGGTGGTIYIPETLYNHLGDNTSLDYKAATNWSTVEGYGTITWAKLEGSAYESTSWILNV